MIPTTSKIAALWRNDPGFVWLDSSSKEQEEISLLGHNPDLVVEGKITDLPLLAAELEKRKRDSSCTVPLDGAAIGFFRFDGSFCFGFYDTLLVHSRSGWSGEIPTGENTTCEEKTVLQFHPEMDRSEYVSIVCRAQEYIAAGDIYQVCLAHRFSSEFSGDPWPLYLALRQASPAPHAAYLNLGNEIVLSSSPECFLKMSDRKVVTRPIKGTRPRMTTPSEDAQQEMELKTSSKEIAELVMITDLERNDLGRVCEFGSVTATQLIHLERYAQVFHLVSTIEGMLKKEMSHLEALLSCFPGGSISGAPKKRALEIIRELERSPRGLFSGAIGYFGYNGESQFNIAIRTLTIRKEQQGKYIAEFHVGAGITADSDPEREWEETLHKAAGIFLAAREG
jgi:aminodeoxychorismate synthase component I